MLPLWKVRTLPKRLLNNKFNKNKRSNKQHKRKSNTKKFKEKPREGHAYLLNNKKDYNEKTSQEIITQTTILN